MKLLLENWRKFINEEVEEFAQGDAFDDFLSAHPEESLSAFRRLGADKKILSIISKYTALPRQQTGQAWNQIVAVLAGSKPMFYGAASSIKDWRAHDLDCYDEQARLNPTPTEVLQEENCPAIEIGKFIVDNAHKVGLTYEPVLCTSQQECVVFGKPESVAATVKEFNRVGSVDNADAQFHRVMGRALGYPEEDIEAFVDALPVKK